MVTLLIKNQTLLIESTRKNNNKFFYFYPVFHYTCNRQLGLFDGQSIRSNENIDFSIQTLSLLHLTLKIVPELLNSSTTRLRYRISFFIINDTPYIVTNRYVCVEILQLHYCHQTFQSLKSTVRNILSITHVKSDQYVQICLHTSYHHPRNQSYLTLITTLIEIKYS